MRHDYNISLHELVMSLSHALDLVDPAMSYHHKRAAYTALRIAEALSIKGRDKEDIVIAAALHDIGALSNRERSLVMSMDSGQRHARFGYQLLMKFAPFAEAARLVRFHHIPWERGFGATVAGEAVPSASHIVHLADRVDAFLDGEGPILKQGQRARDRIAELRGTSFVPEHVDAFLAVSRAESFWLDLDSPSINEVVAARTPFSTIEMDLDGLLDFASLLAQVIDFRSRFTATHSSGVGAVAAILASLIGFSERDCKRIQVGGYLHDIGKLAVPVDLLEQEGGLSDDDRLVINTHSYYSYRILSPISGLEDIAAWCGMHHERLTGGGYPFNAVHFDIPLEARIIAVADVFTALTEDRPYRSGMDPERVRRILREMAAATAIDAKVADLLCDNYAVVDRYRTAAQTEAENEYREFMESLAELDLSAARDAHLSWRHRLRAYLDGQDTLTREQIASHHDCALGQWYFAEGLHYYRHIPEMHQLAEPHEALHRLTHELVELREQGRSDEAEECLRRIEPLSRRIVELLTAIERKAADAVADESGARELADGVGWR